MAKARLVGVSTLVAALSWLVTGCGGGPAGNGVATIGNGTTTTAHTITTGRANHSGGSGPTKAQLLTYAVCMRAHGIRDFPDPTRSPLGGYGFRDHARPGSDLDPNSPRYELADEACRRDVPPSIADATPAEMAANALKWSECMRAHGEPDFPGPNGRGLIKIVDATGIMDPNSSRFKRAEKACQSLGSRQFDLQIAPGPAESGGLSSNT